MRHDKISRILQNRWTDSSKGNRTSIAKLNDRDRRYQKSMRMTCFFVYILSYENLCTRFFDQVHNHSLCRWNIGSESFANVTSGYFIETLFQDVARYFKIKILRNFKSYAKFLTSTYCQVMISRYTNTISCRVTANDSIAIHPIPIPKFRQRYSNISYFNISRNLINNKNAITSGWKFQETDFFFRDHWPSSFFLIFPSHAQCAHSGTDDDLCKNLLFANESKREEMRMIT